MQKFEYPGYELDEHDAQFKLMLAWAEYHAHFQRHEDTIRRIGAEVLAAVASSSLQLIGHTDVCKELLHRHAAGMNDRLDDIEVAINGLQDWQVEWSDDSFDTGDLSWKKGRIVRGTVSMVPGDLIRGSVVSMHIKDHHASGVIRPVDMASMQNITLSSATQ